MRNLLGFDSPFSTTYTVLLGENRLVRSRSVTFEFNAYQDRRAPKDNQTMESSPEIEMTLPSQGVEPVEGYDSPRSGDIDNFEDNESLEDLFQDLPVV